MSQASVGKPENGDYVAARTRPIRRPAQVRYPVVCSLRRIKSPGWPSGSIARRRQKPGLSPAHPAMRRSAARPVGPGLMIAPPLLPPPRRPPAGWSIVGSVLPSPGVNWPACNANAACCHDSDPERGFGLRVSPGITIQPRLIAQLAEAARRDYGRLAVSVVTAPYRRADRDSRWRGVRASFPSESIVWPLINSLYVHGVWGGVLKSRKKIELKRRRQDEKHAVLPRCWKHVNRSQATGSVRGQRLSPPAAAWPATGRLPPTCPRHHRVQRGAEPR